MNSDPPADRDETSAPATESSAARDYAYPSDLAGLVLTRWHDRRHVLGAGGNWTLGRVTAPHRPAPRALG
jgi:hypothetical protein